MVYEPYIHTGTGEITWFEESQGHRIVTRKKGWFPYAEWEREKLKELGLDHEGFIIQNDEGYTINGGDKSMFGRYESRRLTKYSIDEYRKDSESNRLLKRAEFLKAVCEKEGVPWLESSCGEPEEDLSKACYPEIMRHGKIIMSHILRIEKEEKEWRKNLLEIIRSMDHYGLQKESIEYLRKKYT